MRYGNSGIGSIKISLMTGQVTVYVLRKDNKKRNRNDRLKSYKHEHKMKISCYRHGRRHGICIIAIQYVQEKWGKGVRGDDHG